MNLKLILNLLLPLLLITNSKCRSFLFYESLQKTSFYQCLKSQGNDRVVLVLPYSDNQVDGECLQNTENALNGGLRVDVLFGSWRCRSPQKEVQFLKAKLQVGNYDRYWLLVGADTSTCLWMQYTPKQNCQYLQQLLNAFKNSNLTLGIITDGGTWRVLFRSQTACPQINNSLLWWIPEESEQSQDLNFDTYHQIGGWKTPYAKIVTSIQSCGQWIATNYYI